MALILDWCTLMGEPDPAAFYALSPELRDLWLEHVSNLWTGAYQAPPEKKAR